MIMIDRKHPKIRKILKVMCFFVWAWRSDRYFCFTKGKFVSRRITCREAWVLAEISTGAAYEFTR